MPTTRRPLRVRPTDRAAWRTWLARHHATALEVFVEFARKGFEPTTVTYGEAVDEALCFGWIDGVRHKVDENHYSNRFTPRRPGSAWSAINKQKLAELAAAGRMHAAGLAAIERAKADGSWAKITLHDLPDTMPAELAAALAKSARAKRAYEALAPGQQKSWRRWVSDAKRAETRAERATRTVAQLVAGFKDARSVLAPATVRPRKK